MIICPKCGGRVFSKEAELAELVAILKVVLVQRHNHQGHLVIGTGPTGTLEWAKAQVQFRIEHEADSVAIRWDSQALKPEGT